MKRFAFALLAFTGLAEAASAATLNPDALVCITQRLLKRYEVHEAAGEIEFMKQMRGRADCVINRKAENISFIGQVGPYVNYERLDGMELWTRAKDITRSGEVAGD